MRYIIFSDLHSNLESLKVFRDLSETIDHDKKVFLGDLVGYCADPNRCTEWVRENADIVLGGNHDFAAVDRTDFTYFNSHAYQACLWTRLQLTEENKDFLKSLPCAKEEDGIYWVHSSPFEPEQWHYVNNRKDGKIHFDHFSEPLCFLGHSHRPVVIEKHPDGKIEDHFTSSWDLKPDCRYIINVGSLGQPRDGNPKPAFVVYDSDARTIEFHRYEYDFSATQKKIRESGLPFLLADRLSVGR